MTDPRSEAVFNLLDDPSRLFHVRLYVTANDPGIRVIVHEAVRTYAPLVPNKGADHETWELFMKLDAQELEKKISSVLSSSPPNTTVTDGKSGVDPNGSDENNEENCMSDSPGIDICIDGIPSSDDDLIVQDDDDALDTFAQRKQNKYYDSHVVEQIFTRFANSDHVDGIRDLSRRSGIPRATISRWRKKFQSDASWRPGTQRYQHNRRVLSDAEEESLAQMIREQYVMQERPLTLPLLKTLILGYVHEDMDPKSDGIANTTDQKIKFKCSRSYMKLFLKRHGLSYRAVRPAKRQPIDSEEVTDF